MLAAYAAQLDSRGLEDIAVAIESWPPSLWTDAVRLAVHGDLAATADALAALPARSPEARLRLVAGESLAQQGRVAEGVAQLFSSLDFRGSVGATFWIRRTEGLLAEAQRDSA